LRCQRLPAWQETKCHGVDILLRFRQKIRRKHSIEFAVEDLHPESASAHGEGETVVEAGKRVIAWRYAFDLRGGQTNFYYGYTRTLLQNGRVVRNRSWKETLPRDHQ
jgi:hypothetical protein